MSKFKEWLESKQGLCAADTDILRFEQYTDVYFARLEAAFNAGMAAIPDTSKSLEINKDFANHLLFECPESGEQLMPMCEPVSDENGYEIRVMSKSGKSKWKHTIKSEEI